MTQPTQTESPAQEYQEPPCDCGDTHNRAFTSCTLPVTPYYVASQDQFMSGWTHMENPQNNPVVPCDSYPEAVAVLAYVKSRSDQKRIRITSSKPRPQGVVNLVLGWKTRARELVTERFAEAERLVDYSQVQDLRDYRAGVGV